MNLFFGSLESPTIARLSEEDAYHCFRVLRMKAGEEIFLTDGHGTLYSGTLQTASSKECLVKIYDSKENYGKKNYFLHVGIAPTKNIDRFEWFLEKATEIGIHEITPLLCRHAERKILKEERLQKILLSAMKQSVQTFLPKLNPLTSFETFISGVLPGRRFICNASADQALKDTTSTSSLVVCIGPEGDFSEEELSHAKQNGFIPVHLGQNRLRTETAGIVACTIVSLAGH